jgi:hypothetical protein
LAQPSYLTQYRPLLYAHLSGTTPRISNTDLFSKPEVSPGPEYIAHGPGICLVFRAPSFGPVFYINCERMHGQLCHWGPGLVDRLQPGRSAHVSGSGGTRSELWIMGLITTQLVVLIHVSASPWKVLGSRIEGSATLQLYLGRPPPFVSSRLSLLPFLPSFILTCLLELNNLLPIWTTF